MNNPNFIHIVFALCLLLVAVSGLESYPPPPSTSTNSRLWTSLLDRRHAVAALIATAPATGSFVMASPAMAHDAPRQKLVFRSADPTTGVEIADIRMGSTTSPMVTRRDKVNVHITGRLLGKNGWIFENSSQQEGEPYRLQLGVGGVVPGLEQGLVGMAEGGTRRIVVPSEQGYLTKQLEPIPRDFGNRQRLYTTVMNSVRVDRERELLGSDLAGKIVFDVELLRIR